MNMSTLYSSNKFIVASFAFWLKRIEETLEVSCSWGSVTGDPQHEASEQDQPGEWRLEEKGAREGGRVN